MKTKLKFLWVLLTLLVGGVNGAWADEVYTVTYDGTTVNTSTGTATFTTSTTYQATEHVQLYVGSGWGISSNKITGTALPTNGNGTYDNQNNYLLPTSGSYLKITPSQNGSITVNGNKNSGSNKYLHIQTSNTNFVSGAAVTLNETACEWKNERNGYNVTTTGAVVATFSVQSGTTYYIFFNQFNGWSFTGFTFTKQKIDVAASDFGFLYTSRNTHSGETFSGNPLVNLHNLPVTYSSSNESAATVNSSTGEVTIQNVSSGIQTTTIKASFAGNDDYNAKDVTYTLNVGPALVYRDIAISNLRYRPGVNGISGNQLNRSVGGFDLTFGNNEGIKCNNTNNFYFRTNSSGAKGSMTIALDGNNNNGSNYIKKIVFTAWGTPSLSVNSVARTSGTLTQTGASEWTWTQYYDNVRDVTFTSQGENDESILISNIKVYTNSLPTFTKDTPVPGFNRSSDSKAVGETVNISDLDISTTPGSFLFNYDFNAGGTGLSHTPFTNNTTWPGTISGTASAGTATIAASFDGTSNPFFNTVASTTVYTLTVGTAPSGEKHTMSWDFTGGANTIDKKILSAASTNVNWTWDTNKWKLTNAISSNFVTQGGFELELAYGLKINSKNSSSTDIENDGFRINKEQSIIIPTLKLGDIVTVTYSLPNSDRYITPSNLTEYSASEDASSHIWTGTGTVTANGDVTLTTSDALIFKTITIQTENKPRPTLSFANGSNVNIEIPVGETETTYTNALTTEPSGATVTYSVLVNNATLNEDGTVASSAGGAVVSGSTVSGIKVGTTVIRATVTGAANYCDYYCDYIITATQASGIASWSYTADAKEIDGEDRPYQGIVTFTKSGTIDSGTTINDIPGLIVDITANTNVANIGYYDTNRYYGLAYDAKGGISFTPSVNGFLSLQGNFYGDVSLGSITIHTGDGGAYYKNLTEISTPLIAGTTYTLTTSSNYNFNLAAFRFRPAFLTPNETAEQTTTFEAYSSTTEFPKLVHSSDAGVRFSGNRSVVNLQSNGGVTLVGGGTAIVRGKVISGENSLTAYYTLNANVLSLTGTNPTNGSTITSLDNSVFQFLFDQNIALLDGTKFVVLKDATDITSNCTIALNTNSSETDYQKRLNVSGFGTLESGSTYTIRLLAGAVSKSGEASIKNAEVIGTFIVESTEPPLTWIYPSTTSAVRVGTSIVLQTSAKIDEHYPTAGIIGSLIYEGGGSESDYPMEMKAVKDGDKIVFKPTKPLIPNKLYTLTVGANQVKLDGNSNMITKDKVFLFTTGTATGTAPTVVSNNSPWSHSAGTIELTFNTSIELEPYSKIYVTPINGNEPTASGTSAKLNNSGSLVDQSLSVVEGNKLQFSFSLDDLKYDLWYELILPNNTVTGPGGQPNNQDYVFRFKMDPKGSGLVATAFTGYPYTWNFTNFGTRTSTLTDFASVKSSSSTSRWQETDGHYGNYVSNNTNSGGTFFPQGEVASYKKEGTDIEIAEMRGLRWSLVKYYGSGNNRMQIPTSGNSLNMVGGTHYLTIPNVPAGKLYIKARNSYKFDINTPGVTFIQGGQTDNTKGATGGNDQIFIVNVPTAGDVSFCLQDVNFKMIAVATEEKAISSVGYATNARDYPVDYTLNETLLGTGVTAYKITGVNGGSVVASTVTKVPATTATDQFNGVMLHGSEGSWPLFTLDVNSTTETLTDNKLIGVVSGVTTGELDQKTGNNYNYVLSNGGYTVKYETGQTTGKVVGEASGVGFYLLLKDGTILANNSTYSKESPNDYTAYLQLGEQYVMHTEVGVSSARQFFSIDFGDETTDIKVIGSESSTKTSDGAYYSLQGVRLDNPGKGIYIRNGKMVVVK